MNVCRADRMAARALLGAPIGVMLGVMMSVMLLTTAFPSPPAFAQTSGQVGAPRSLVPKTLMLPMTSDDGEKQTEDRRPEPPIQESPDAPADDKQGIEIDRLDAVAADSVVVLDPDGGGFDPNIWAGTSRETFARWVRLLPSIPRSQVARSIAVRLLLSGAALVPTDTGDKLTDLLTLRAETLFRMGESAGLQQLFMAIPSRLDSEVLARLQTDHLLLNNDLARACQIVARMVNRSESRDWQKTRVFCDALGGHWDRVEFGIQLLFELGEQDPVFFSLMQYLGTTRAAGKPIPESAPRIATIEGLRPLDHALLRVAGLSPPIVEGQLPAAPFLASMVSFREVPFNTRLWLAEEGEARGLLNTEAVISLFNAISVGADLLESALTIAQADPGPNSRALLFRASQTQDVDLAAAQAIQLALRQAREGGTLDRAARLYLNRLNALPAGSELSWFAADAATGFFAAARPVLSLPWMAVARREALLDPSAVPTWVRLWAIARLGGGDQIVPWDEIALQQWRSAARQRDPVGASRQASLLLALLEATGDPMSPTVWRDLVTAPTVRSGHIAAPAVRRALTSALEGERVCEALMLVVLSLGEAPLDRLDSDTLVQAVGALWQLGYVDEARALAVETALSHGL